MKNKQKNIVILLLSLGIIIVTIWSFYSTQKVQPNTTNIETKKANKTPELKYTVSVCDSSQKGYLLLTPSQLDNQTGYYVIMDMTGKIIAKKQFDNEIFDFRQWHINNKTYYSYGTHDKFAFHNKALPTPIPIGHIVILDSALNEISSTHMLPHDDIKNEKNKDLDPHDLIFLSENHMINLVSYEKPVNNIPASLNPVPNKRVYAAIIQESVDGKVIWQWDATKFPEFYYNTYSKESHFNDTLPADYLHVNTLLLDPKDSNLIISFRDLNQILKINRKSGDIMWRLGGKNSDYQLTDQQKFLGQHAISWSDNYQTLLFIDNGHPTKRPYTRIAEFKLDEKNKKIVSYNATRMPHLYIPTRGNVSKLGDNYLISGGVSSYILIFDPKTEKFKFEMQMNLSSYRVYWVENICGLEKKNLVQ